MKKIMLLIISLCFFGNETIFAESIILSTGEYPPLNSKSLKHYGLIPKIVKEAFLLEGVQVSFKFYPWKRAYFNSVHGKVDGTVQWFYSKERERENYYSDPIMEEKVVWFHLKSMVFSWSKLQDLKAYKIGAISGFTYNSEFYKAYSDKQINVEFLSEPEKIFNMLLFKRIHVFPEMIDVGYDTLQKNFPQETVDLFTHHPKPFIVTQNHLLLTRKKKKSPILLKKFNKGLRLLKKSGRYDQYITESRNGDYK